MEMKLWQKTKRLFFKTKAQSLLELAVFGSILLMLLGLLINYGLRYNYQQQVTQQTFRTAMASAGSGEAISHVRVQDVHIPDPGNPFGMGAIMPVSAAASITRSFELGKIPDFSKPEEVYAESPKVEIKINDAECLNNPECRYTTAGFRFVSGVSEGAIEKYQLIYGAGNVDEIPESKRCVKEGKPVRDDPEYIDEPACEEFVKDLAIFDSSAGQIIDYDNTLRRCRQILDESVCIKECQKDVQLESESTTDCGKICKAEIEVPAYCTPPSEVAKKIANRKYRMAKMGLQEDYWQETNMENILHKKTDQTTTENVDWKVDTHRTIIYNTAQPDEKITIGKKEVITSVSQNQTKTW